MSPIEELFPRLQLCRSCEALFTTPSNLSKNESIQDKIFLTSEGYEYTRTRGELEKSSILGCELCSQIVESDKSYTSKRDARRVVRSVPDLHSDRKRPAWYPSLSQDILFRAVLEKPKYENGWYDSLKVSILSWDGKRNQHLYPIRWPLFSTKGNPASLYVRHQAPLTVTMPIKNLQIAKRRLLECNKAHKECHDQKIAELPTRLVDLSSFGSLKTAHLRSTAGKKGRYAALSYCWGGDQAFKTTIATCPKYAEGLPYADLPKTILDAFEVARTLGLQLIWIDSLCIIQDDEEDIYRGLSKMVQVYQNATVTISAASASNCHDGFLKESYLFQTLYHLPVRVLNGHFGTFIVSKKQDAPFGSRKNNFGHGLIEEPAAPTKQPINSRAWTLQENLLSPCLLIFTTTGMYWKCQTESLAKTLDSRGNIVGEYDNEFRVLLEGWGFVANRRKDIFTDDEDGAFLRWSDLVANYTKRELSQESDRLQAIAAAAEAFSTRFNCDYLAGLWRKNLTSELAWQLDDSSLGPPPREYQGPSWSWASVNGSVVIGTSIEWETYTARVLDCSTVLASASSKWGAVTSGRLIIEACLIDFSTNYQELRHWKGIRNLRGIDGVHWDRDWKASPSDSYSSIWLLVFGTKRRRTLGKGLVQWDAETWGYDVHGLVLGKRSSKENLYRRLGYYQHKDDENKYHHLFSKGPEHYQSSMVVVTII